MLRHYIKMAMRHLLKKYDTKSDIYRRAIRRDIMF